MASLHGLLVSTFFALAAGLAWMLAIRPMYRVWGALNDRMADRVTQSAELLRECAAPGERR